MRAIHLVRLDKIRPALILTAEVKLAYLSGITVAPIRSTIRGIATEVRVGQWSGLDHPSVVSCDGITTVEAEDILVWVGFLPTEDEPALAAAIHAAFDLEP